MFLSRYKNILKKTSMPARYFNFLASSWAKSIWFGWYSMPPSLSHFSMFALSGSPEFMTLSWTLDVSRPLRVLESSLNLSENLIVGVVFSASQAAAIIWSWYFIVFHIFLEGSTLWIYVKIILSTPILLWPNVVKMQQRIFLFIQEKPFQHGITSVGHCYFQSVLQYFEKCCEQFQPCFPPWNVYWH